MSRQQLRHSSRGLKATYSFLEAFTIFWNLLFFVADLEHTIYMVLIKVSRSLISFTFFQASQMPKSSRCVTQCCTTNWEILRFSWTATPLCRPKITEAPRCEHNYFFYVKFMIFVKLLDYRDNCSFISCLELYNLTKRCYLFNNIINSVFKVEY